MMELCNLTEKGTIPVSACFGKLFSLFLLSRKIRSSVFLIVALKLSSENVRWVFHLSRHDGIVIILLRIKIQEMTVKYTEETDTKNRVNRCSKRKIRSYQLSKWNRDSLIDDYVSNNHVLYLDLTCFIFSVFSPAYFLISVKFRPFKVLLSVWLEWQLFNYILKHQVLLHGICWREKKKDLVTDKSQGKNI